MDGAVLYILLLLLLLSHIIYCIFVLYKYACKLYMEREKPYNIYIVQINLKYVSTVC